VHCLRVESVWWTGGPSSFPGEAVRSGVRPAAFDDRRERFVPRRTEVVREGCCGYPVCLADWSADVVAHAQTCMPLD